MKVFVIVAVLIVSALAAPGVIDNKIESDSSVSKMMQYFGGCADNEDFTTCIAVKGITALSRAARASNIKITEGITLARDPAFNARAGKAISENEIVSSLPAEPEQRSARLYDMALETINNFFSSHSLQVKFPTEEVSRAFEEGRKKKLKKLIPALLMGLVGKKIFAIVPLFVVGLALLAFKALITAKIAFLLAVFLALSKGLSGLSGGGGSGLGILGKVAGLSAGGLGAGLGAGLLGGLSGGSGGSGGGLGGLGSLSGGNGGSSGSGYSNTGATGGGYSSQGSQGWSSGSGNSAYPYARSYDDAQDLAYNGQAQNE